MKLSDLTGICTKCALIRPWPSGFIGRRGEVVANCNVCTEASRRSYVANRRKRLAYKARRMAQGLT